MRGGEDEAAFVYLDLGIAVNGLRKHEIRQEFVFEREWKKPGDIGLTVAS